MIWRGPTSSRSLAREHWQLLGVLGIAGFFEGYDSYTFTVALPQIRESFGLSQGAASVWLSVLFLGSLPAVFLARRADVEGRRRLLVTTIVAYSLFTGLTAVAPNMGVFVAAQFCARVFLNAEVVLAWTMVAEELPASKRGFGFGWLAMLSALGAASGSLAYGAWLVPYDLSWRWLYFIALPPLALVIAAKRVLPESHRYDEARTSGEINTRWSDILRRPHRRWMVLVGGTDLLFALATIAEVFAIDFMQTDRGLSVTSSNLVLVAAGLLAIPVLVFAGSLSDSHGRKRIGCFFGILSVAGLIGFFFLADHPFELFGFMSLALIGQFGAWPTLDAYTAELFPTGLRAFASSFTSLWRVLGETASLLLGGALMALSGSLGATVGLLAAGPLIAVIIIWWKFPETHGVELEDILEAPTDMVGLAPRKHAPARAHFRAS